MRKEKRYMKKASSILYLIYIIVGLVTFVGYIVLGTLGIANVLPPEFIQAIKNAFSYTGADLLPLWIVIFSEAGLQIICCLFVAAARKQVKKNNGRIGLQILAIVFGALAWNPLPILGGIFGIIGIKSK